MGAAGQGYRGDRDKGRRMGGWLDKLPQIDPGMALVARAAHFFGIKLKKGFIFGSWLKIPMSPVMMDLIQIDKESNQPKYLQIVVSVIDSIEKGRLKRGTQLPSISELAEWQQMAKVTVAKAYEQLRQMGVVLSQHGKGFYVAKTDIKNKLNVFLLFDTLNAYKEILYNALKSALPADTHFSIFFHHYDKRLFSSLINNNLGNFNYYIVMPHFDEDV